MAIAAVYANLMRNDFIPESKNETLTPGFLESINQDGMPGCPPMGPEGPEQNTPPQDLSHMSEEVSQIGAEANANDEGVSALLAAMNDDGIGEKAKYINAPDRDSQIDLTLNHDGSCTVSINGETQQVGADEADRLIVSGGNGNDRINVHQQEAPEGAEGTQAQHKMGVLINGGEGADKINVDRNVTQNLYINGGKGENTIIDNGQGNDTIIGGKGRNFIVGGEGDNTIIGGEGQNVIYAGGDGDNHIEGGKGSNFIVGGGGNDTIIGGEGNNVLFGMGGDDTIIGGKGTNTLIGGTGVNNIQSGEGSNTIRYGSETAQSGNVQANEGDDVKQLEPMQTPDNLFTNKADDMWFRRNMRDNLEAMGQTDPGQAMLKGLGETDHAIGFAQGRAGEASAQPRESLPMNILPSEINLDDKGDIASVGASDTKIQIDPSLMATYKDDPQVWSETNVMIGMAHEMCHAYNNATGTMNYTAFNNDSGQVTDRATDARAINGAEMQAVGFNEDSLASANPYGMRENDFRSFFHMEQRTSYLPEQG